MWLLDLAPVRHAFYTRAWPEPIRARARARVDQKRATLIRKGHDEWGEDAGFLYDLHHRLTSRDERASISRTHYAHTLAAINELGYLPATIVDYGCGPGFLTQEIADSFPTATIVAADQREETLALNRRLQPQVIWRTFADVEAALFPAPRVLVLDGVANYMTATQLDALLPGFRSVVFYYAADEQSEPEGNHGIGFLETLNAHGFQTNHRQVPDTAMIVGSANRDGGIR